MSVDNSHIRVLALKKAEMSDEIIVRLVEQDGEAAPHVRVKFAAPIAAAREVNGQEQPIGPATLDDGSSRNVVHALRAAHICICGLVRRLQSFAPCNRSLSRLPTIWRRPRMTTRNRSAGLRQQRRCAAGGDAAVVTGIQWGRISPGVGCHRDARRRDCARSIHRSCRAATSTACTCWPPQTDGDQNGCIPGRETLHRTDH